MDKLLRESINLSRKNTLAKEIVIVDGQAGCGKTLFSPIIATLDRVELMMYAFEVEWICRMHYMEKISDDAASSFVSMMADHKLYQVMMGREINCRFKDLSSVFQTANPWKYLQRLYQLGDTVIPERVENQRPILHWTTHNLLAYGQPVLESLTDRVSWIVIVRHPLYMVKQQERNMDHLPSNPRDVDVYFEYKDMQFPYFVYGWEEKFIKSNSMEKAIYYIELMTKKYDQILKILEKDETRILVIPFEKFVLEPEIYMQKIIAGLKSKMTKYTHKEMRRQKIPRKMIAEGRKTKIYERCGWTPPQSKNEIEEFRIRRNMVKEVASCEALAVMDQLCQKYEKNFLGEIFLERYQS